MLEEVTQLAGSESIQNKQGKFLLVLEIISGREEFSHMIRLCKDPDVVGNRLLEEVTQLTGSETDKQGKLSLVFV